MATPQEALQPELQLIPGQVKALYHIVKGKGRNSHWRKFGAAFVNKDGSINLIIDLFPGQHFQVRDYDPISLEESEMEEIVEEKVNGKKSKGK